MLKKICNILYHYRVPGASFSFDPILNWVQLLGQRKRWVNGTISTYTYFLIDKEGKLETTISDLGTKGHIQKAWLLQLYTSAVTVITPAFYAISAFESCNTFQKNYPETFINITLTIPGTGVVVSTPVLMSAACYIIYILWVLNAIFMGRKPNFMNKEFYNFMMEIVYYIFNMVTSLFSTFVLLNILTLPAVIGGSLNYLLVIIATMWLTPLVLSLVISPSTAYLYILYGIPYVFQLTQYIVFIPAFAFARMHDLSWGNRDVELSGHDEIASKKEREIKARDFYGFTLRSNVFTAILNLMLLVAYIGTYVVFGHVILIIAPLMVMMFLPMGISMLFALIFIAKSFSHFAYKRLKKYFYVAVQKSRVLWRKRNNMIVELEEDDLEEEEDYDFYDEPLTTAFPGGNLSTQSLTSTSRTQDDTQVSPGSASETQYSEHRKHLDSDVGSSSTPIGLRLRGSAASISSPSRVVKPSSNRSADGAPTSPISKHT